MNLKQEIRDSYFVVEVVRQKLKTGIKVERFMTESACSAKRHSRQ
jgi:hypothetical protein